ncbi:hypothetical protein PENSPDRAFT_661647 [Peniophora sp. CONT]|nr:hypothetical protein PENSPDRAFT_661647 [Peniophora sp. CONT]
MEFFSILIALVAVLTVDATVLNSRQTSGSECAGAVSSMAVYDRPFVYPLFLSCKNALGNSAAAKEDPWVNRNCVAAAVAASIPIFHDGLTCGVSTGTVDLTPISTWPSLDTNVYASIVGSTDGRITQQNFIDLIYGAISEEGGAYPDSAATLIEYYIQPVFNWTALSIADGIPYTNFNDWLHYSPTVNHCYPFACA